MAAVVRADCVVTALTQMTLTAVTHNIVEEDGSCTPSTLNMNAIAETGTRNCRVDVQKIISKRQQFKFKRGATSCYIKLDLRRHAASQYVQQHYVYRLNCVKRFFMQFGVRTTYNANYLADAMTHPPTPLPHQFATCTSKNHCIPESELSADHCAAIAVLVK